MPDYVLGISPCHEIGIDLTVQFRDCDPMGILWHGHHLAYCEAARHELGNRIGLGVGHLMKAGLQAPVVASRTRHHAVARPGDILHVDCALYPSAQPRLLHRYRLNVGTRLVSEVETEQVLTRGDMIMLLSLEQPIAAILHGRP